ncbi:hypothetical protein ACQPXM_36740 [Kribbella sp. CA-253562]|uniref:hypothetical protein n=1 Tax=Kribbella sp. CA-253562 TaxID=3239942 RepID=UPI003D8CBDF8
MTWQLWVLVAAAVIGAVVLMVARFRKAQRVLDGLIDTIEPHRETARPEHRPKVAHERAEHRPKAAHERDDELARRRTDRQLRTTFVPRAAHGHRGRH